MDTQTMDVIGKLSIVPIAGLVFLQHLSPLFSIPILDILIGHNPWNRNLDPVWAA